MFTFARLEGVQCSSMTVVLLAELREQLKWQWAGSSWQWTIHLGFTGDLRSLSSTEGSQLFHLVDSDISWYLIPSGKQGWLVCFRNIVASAVRPQGLKRRQLVREEKFLIWCKAKAGGAKSPAARRLAMIESVPQFQPQMFSLPVAYRGSCSCSSFLQVISKSHT